MLPLQPFSIKTQIIIIKNLKMLTNSDIYLCTQFQSKIQPISQIKQLTSFPKNMQRTSPITFTLCQSSQKQNKTKILELSINGETLLIQQFDGIFTNYDFCDDYLLLLNKQGDFLLHNMMNKKTHESKKQHPSLFVDTQIMHTNDHFITCGGSIKNQHTNITERLIKIWSIARDDYLIPKSKINTGHSKPIQYCFLMNKNSVLSISLDQSLRITNLITEQLTSVIHTDSQLLSACQIDYNTVIAGGLAQSLKIYDTRVKKCMNIKPIINSQLIHICHIKRFTDHHLLIANLNEMHSLDLKNWQVTHLGNYQGERISEILTLNKSQFVIGNRDKTLQFWKAF